ncbi:glycosyltransferase family 9 protein [Amycolatopsis suaedae]|uniref:Glycosyltransferase family 9 protein n=1 Tax=Amycolatopsis suaedae TaxID=2510978 RepID=A0A4Q7J1F9_9PSEU|nr:glycosyltransferase family 9 protein [Amycolatopsis suaedae]RZQ60223.1 glycosyltransferase family 9 protein [Amycolatopsis suaedae]
MAVTGVLALRALGLGDLLTAVPALRALCRTGPVTLAAPEPLRPLAGLIDPGLDLLPTARLGDLNWPGPPPRLAVNLHGRGPQSIGDLLAARPGRLLTHRHPAFPGVGGPPWQDGVPEVRRWCRLLEHGGIPADPGDLDLREPTVPSPAPGAAVVHPGAAYPARRWPADRFAAVAGELARRGEHVVITGSAGERELAERVAGAAGLPSSAVLAGRTGLAELAALVAGATLVVCGDTGVGHLATAFGTPSVLLFGPTPPARWGPPPERTRHRVLWKGAQGDPFGGEPDRGLLWIEVDEVLAALPAVAGGTR